MKRSGNNDNYKEYKNTYLLHKGSARRKRKQKEIKELKDSDPKPSDHTIYK